MFARSRRIESVGEPSWFTTALGQKPDVLDVDVQGCRIRSRVWGDPDLPPLVFVHGSGAHAGWWDHIAPFFCRTHRVIAPNLSGHGDSECRAVYDLDVWAAEVLAVAAAATSSGRPRPKIVGHSLGGWVTARAAMAFGKQIDSILVIDSPLREGAPPEVLLRNDDQLVTGYRTRREMLARFRAFPTQPVILPYIARHIALNSVRKSSFGWTWKFDPAVFGTNLTPETSGGQELLEETMTRMPCRQGYLRCEGGVVTPAMADRIRSVMQLRGPFIELAEAGHHPMLDQPLPLVAALRTLLEFWSIT